MTAPTPNALRELIDQARDLLTHNPPCPLPVTKDHPPHVNACGHPSLHGGQLNPACLLCSYRWASDAVSSRRVREHVKILGGSTSDPTGEFVTQRLEEGDPEGLRVRKRQIDRQLIGVKNALTTLIAQERSLTHLIEQFVGKSGPEVRYPPGSTLLSRAEKAESWEAKRKREQSGKGFGSG